MIFATVRFAPHAAEPRLLVRHAVEAVSADRDWLESFASDAWVDRGRGATVQVGRHDSRDVGRLVVAAPSGPWWYADVLIDDEHADDVRDIVKVGAPCSVGCRVIREDRDERIGTRHIKLAQLEHVLIGERGSRPGYLGAAVVKVEERAKPTDADWLAGLPAEVRESIQRHGDKPGDIVSIHGVNDRVEWTWNGSRFVAAHRSSRMPA
jgi:hypothetical protein